FRRSPIAGHLADRLERAGDNCDGCTGACSRDGRFRAGVAGTHDDYVELGFNHLSLSSNMPLKVQASRSTEFIRRTAFETAGMQRVDIDTKYNLTDAEFQNEGDLIAIGPLPSDDDLSTMMASLESRGLIYFDDFF